MLRTESVWIVQSKGSVTKNIPLQVTSISGKIT